MIKNKHLVSINKLPRAYLLLVPKQDLRLDKDGTF